MIIMQHPYHFCNCQLLSLARSKILHAMQYICRKRFFFKMIWSIHCPPHVFWVGNIKTFFTFTSTVYDVGEDKIHYYHKSSVSLTKYPNIRQYINIRRVSCHQQSNQISDKKCLRMFHPCAVNLGSLYQKTVALPTHYGIRKPFAPIV